MSSGRGGLVVVVVGGRVVVVVGGKVDVVVVAKVVVLGAVVDSSAVPPPHAETTRRNADPKSPKRR